MAETGIVWLGIILCLSQSAMLSGMNLGLFAMSRLELNVLAKKGDSRAKKVLALRCRANLALVTILWGNVAVNVVLALLSGSVMAGVSAFLFSTVVITVFAEIIPQAYFSRHAVRTAAALSPVLRVYQVLLYPVAAPTAALLDLWLGGEEIRFFPERDLRGLIQLHMDSSESEIDLVEGRGAMNFLELDDVPMTDEGEALDPESIIELPFEGAAPVFPRPDEQRSDGTTFLEHVNRSGKKWIVIVDAERVPRLLLKSDSYTREALRDAEKCRAIRHCHRPVLTRDPTATLGMMIPRFKVRPGPAEDDVVDNDVILLWADTPRIVTGTDILGRLLRGIVK
ncbi:MAG: DUF21 domain-containing protein [Spirochaetaceae bacterium]|nr:MAG: DUF21 domain-containing protein [Spirochaetaceae bacterium]